MPIQRGCIGFYLGENIIQSGILEAKYCPKLFVV